MFNHNNNNNNNKMFIDKGNSYKHEFIKLHPSDETQSVKSI